MDMKGPWGWQEKFEGERVSGCDINTTCVWNCQNK